MFNNLWDIPPSADDPSPRVLRPANDLHIVEPADPIELLRKSGYRRTFGDDVADFIWDIRVHPTLALVCFGGGTLAGLLGVIVPAILIAWVAL